MTLEDFTNNCIRLMEERPETKDSDVIFSIDNEGNEYDYIYCSPSVGAMNNLNEFCNEEDTEGLEDFKQYKYDNVVRIN